MATNDITNDRYNPPGNTSMDFEEFNFGEVYTKLFDPEKVANMLAYILGEEILSESDHLSKYSWDRKLNEYSLKIIASEIEAKC